jgi:hypothetical protein
MIIYLAGAEGGDTDNLIEQNSIRHGFASYYYIRTMKNKAEKMQFLRKHIRKIVIDSGAHSFFSELHEEGMSVSVHIKKTKTKETPDEYWELYKKWLLANQEYFDYFVELDIGEIVGQDKVLQWREELKELGLYHKCITVYHPDVVTEKEWVEYIKDSQSKYVAVEGDRPLRSRLPYGRLLKYAYDHGVRVHGFAMTKKDVMEKYPFYSVDSTSWKAGVMYGRGYVVGHDGVKAVCFKDKKDVSLIKAPMSVKQLNHKTASISCKSRLYLSIKAYQKMENYYTKLWTKRGIVWR